MQSRKRNRRRARRVAGPIEPLESRQLLSKTLYVDANAPSGVTHDGTTWQNAYFDLQLGQSAATSGDQIHVADGTYKPTSGTDRTISFQLKNGVALLGGYAGYGAANPDARNIAANATILSGDIGTIGSNADNSYHVVVGSKTDATAILDGFTITAANANGSSSTTYFGGGMFNSAGSPTLANCIFSANSAGSTYNSGYGGGLYNASDSSPTLTNCSFSANSAIEGGGGGLYNGLNSSTTLTNCSFSANSARNRGGGIYNNSALAALVNCTFSANSGGEGGGMCNVSSSPSLTNCAFSANSAFSGGGVYNSSFSSPTLTNCTFGGNSAGSDGGGMSNDSSSPTLTNCTFSSNLAGSGGGVCNQSSSPALTNCTFSGNSAGSGGGISTRFSSQPKLTNCTFSANSARVYGAGLYNDQCSPILTNCIVWGSGNSPIYNEYQGTPVITYSDIQGGYGGAGNKNADPLFIRSPWTGPDGTFGTGDDDHGDLRLRPGSPVLDVGSNAAIPSGVTTDVAGNPRVENGSVDLGAYEGTTSGPAPKTLYVDQSAVGSNSGTSWANAFVSLQSALAAAADGDTVRVASGIYKPTATVDRNSTFALRDSVCVYGGYAGHDTPDPNTRDIVAYRSVLSGDIGTIGSKTDNSYHVVVGSNTTATALLDGFTITAGNANGSDSRTYSGGGMFSSAGSLTLRNCTFSANWASGAYSAGGAMYNYFSSPTLTNCTFSANLVSGTYSTGGAMYNDSSSPTLTNCTFSRNFDGYGFSGEMYNYRSSIPKLSNCIIWDSASSTIVYPSAGVVTCCDIRGGVSGPGNIEADPLFVRDPSPGGDSVWGTVDDDYGDLRLKSGSPCIDAGLNSAVPSTITTDLAGNPRFADAPGVHDPGAVVDIGAYEYSVTLAGAGGSYQFNNPRPSIKLNFNANLLASSVSAADLLLVNQTSGQTIDCGALMSVTTDAPGASATWTLTSGTLPDGNYRATLPAGSVSDGGGNPLASPITFDFYALTGDANHDRVVDVTDLGILATNWQGSSKTFAQGNFDYSGKVDVTDLGILATNWQKSLAAPASTASLAASAQRLAPFSQSAPRSFRSHSLAADLLA